MPARRDPGTYSAPQPKKRKTPAQTTATTSTVAAIQGSKGARAAHVAAALSTSAAPSRSAPVRSSSPSRSQKRRARQIKQSIRESLRHAEPLRPRAKDYLSSRLQDHADELWKDAKAVTGLKGAPPEVSIGKGNYTYGKRKINLLPSVAADFEHLRAQGVPKSAVPHQKRAGQRILLHEFAHIGQNREPGPDKHKEGRAERYGQLAARRLGIKYKAANGPNYPERTARAKERDSKHEILFGQFDAREEQAKRKKRVLAPRKRAKDAADKARKQFDRVMKTPKVKVAVPSAVPPQYRKAVAKQGQRLNEVVKGTGVTGPEYLAKTIDFETGGTWDPSIQNPTSGAFGLGQFMEGTANSFRSKYGVETRDPSKPRQQIKGAAMHLSGDFDHPPLYAGYNPGYSSSDPIPSRDTGADVTVRIPKKAAKKVAQGGVSPSGPAAKSKISLPVPGKPKQVKSEVIGTPYVGTHTLGNWQSDNAVDIAVPSGTPIRAVVDGKIGRVSGNNNDPSSQFNGFQVYLGDDIWYTHLSKVKVRSGEKVKAGDVIGLSGAANGVEHLHFAVNPDGAVGDPRGYLRQGVASYAGTTSTGTTTSSGSAGTTVSTALGSPGTPAPTPAKRRKKRRRKAASIAIAPLLEQIEAPEVHRSTESYTDYVKQSPVEVAL